MNVNRVKAVPGIVLTLLIMSGSVGAIWVLNYYQATGHVTAASGEKNIISLCNLNIVLGEGEILYMNDESCRADMVAGTWSLTSISDFVSEDANCALSADDIRLFVRNSVWLPEWTELNGDFTFDVLSPSNYALYVKAELDPKHCPLSGDFSIVLTPPT